MRVHCLQHAPFEDLGALSGAFAARRAAVTTTRLYEAEPFPATGAFDLLVVLGGPMSVNDTTVYPWLESEIRFLKSVLQAGRPVLGLCLGAQLLARALGARVIRNADKEIGWFPVERVADSRAHRVAAALPDRFEAFHWHGETFDLPCNVLHLARSEGCRNQGYIWGDRVLGLQFHLETTPEGVRALSRHCPEDLAPGRYVQAPELMLHPPERFLVAHELMARVLDALVESR